MAKHRQAAAAYRAAVVARNNMIVEQATTDLWAAIDCISVTEPTAQAITAAIEASPAVRINRAIRRAFRAQTVEISQ